METEIETSIEFKYEKSDENVMMQLAGKLQGLKPLNRSMLNPVLNGDTLELHISYVDPALLIGRNNRDFDGVFEVLGIIFSQTIVWAKLIVDERESKLIINPDVEVKLITKEKELIIHIVGVTELADA